MSTAISLKSEGDRAYLDGFRPMSWGTGEMCEFASALTRMLDCVGESVPYHYVLGVTGAAFRFTIGRELWNPGFYGFELVAEDYLDLIRRAFAAVGYAYDWHAKGDLADDARRIRDSIGRGIAVMLRGNLVDASDWVLITGYEGNGERLYASSTYGGGGDAPGGCAKVADWHGKTREYVILGQRSERPRPADVYAEALRLAVRLIRTGHIHGRHTGLAAYDALAGALRQQDYPEHTPGKEDDLWFRYLCILCYQMMLDDHRSAPAFLRDAANALPECESELAEAAECYEHACTLRDHLDDVIKGDFSEEAQMAFRDPDVRERYARVLLRIRDTDARAASHIEKALARGCRPAG